MKHLILKAILLLTFGIVSCYAEVPDTMNFQGYLTDEAGQPVKGTVDISFSIPGTHWRETHRDVPLKQGVFNVQLGNMAEVDFTQGHQWLHIDVNGVSQPPAPISSVPYAFHAQTVETEKDPTVPDNLKDGVSWNEISGKPTEIADGDDVGSYVFGGMYYVVASSCYKKNPITNDCSCPTGFNVVLFDNTNGEGGRDI